MTFKLYYTPTSCGAANFIAAKLAGLTFDSEQVDIRDHKTASGEDFYAINPKGNVPTIVADDTVINENVATLQYIAMQNPESGLLPAAGTAEFYGAVANLAFVATEMHKNIGALFNPTIHSEVREYASKNFVARAKYFEETMLGDKEFTGGDKPHVADIYAYIVLSWCGFLGIELSDGLKAFYERVKAYDGVEAAHAEMNEASK